MVTQPTQQCYLNHANIGQKKPFTDKQKQKSQKHKNPQNSRKNQQEDFPLQQQAPHCDKGYFASKDEKGK